MILLIVTLFIGFVVIGSVVPSLLPRLLSRKPRGTANGGSRMRPVGVSMVSLQYAMVLVVATLCALCSGLCAALIDSGDAVAASLRAGGGHVTMSLRTVSPMTASPMRGSDCQTDAVVQWIESERIRSPSSATVHVFADAAHCRWRQGGVYRASGTLGEPKYGQADAWLTLKDKSRDMMLETETPGRLDTAVEAMRHDFIDVTRRLSDQGRVLVPGLTMGVLGQDAYLPETGWSGFGRSGEAQPIDGNYAEALEDDFKAAGIMHLMAVSGGHFVLVAAMVTRLASFLLLPRWAKAVAVTVAYASLTMLMFPADSVLRAFAMGLFGVACLLAGRRSQALSALNWTVILSLIFDPSLAVSFGFALSCASVYGIVLLYDVIRRPMSRWMPGPLADAAAVTLAAQCLTLPIQVLMSPDIPIWSVPANCIAAPVVAFATVAGLASLLVSWALPSLGFMLAWLSGCGTWVLERCATLLGGDHTLAWPEGVPGMLGVCGAEIAVALAIWGIRYAIAARSAARGRSAPGEYRATWFEHAAGWWEETRGMLLKD
ncbi:ComEC/Rec2 family competence protein [Bifidobacterium simiarum]|nr:ComEC/Rec2 family competence protein [Bifidobacterium simiarum]